MARLDHARKLAIAERLRGLRDRDPSVKQPHVAEAARVSLRTVQLWEAGESTPDWEHAEALAKFYAVDVDWMMGRTEAEKRGPVPGGFSVGDPQLDRIEAKLDALADRLDGLSAASAADAADAAEEAAQPQRKRRDERDAGASNRRQGRPAS